MTWALFLDDERSPSWDIQEALIARSVDEAKELVVAFGLPNIISFDHDLGKDVPSAMEFMWWLVEQDLEGSLDLNSIERIIVHSANPVGAQNLAGLWDGYASNELDSEVRAELKPRTTHK